MTGKLENMGKQKGYKRKVKNSPWLQAWFSGKGVRGEVKATSQAVLGQQIYRLLQNTPTVVTSLKSNGRI
jgi:hypothetical protein